MKPGEEGLPPVDALETATATAEPDAAAAAVEGVGPEVGTPTADVDGHAEGEGGGPAEELSPFEKRLAELAEAEDPTELRRDREGPPAPEQLPEGWSRDAQGKLRDAQGNFARLPTAPAPEAPAPEAPAAAPALAIKIPGRRPEDPELELPIPAEVLEAHGIDPKQLEEGIARLRNGYRRNDQLLAERQTVEEGRQYLDSIVEQLGRPEGAADFVLERVNPAAHVHIVRRLLATMPEADFEQVLDLTARWDREPVARREAAVEEREKRTKAIDDRERQSAAQAADRTQANKIVDEVAKLIPEEWDDRRAAVAFRSALDQLMVYADQHNLETLDPAQVHVLLDRLGVLDALGLPKGGPPPADPKRSAAVAKVTDAQAQKAARTGQELQARAQRRKDVSAVASGGAGSAIPAARPPRGAHKTGEERINWLAKLIGV